MNWWRRRWWRWKLWQRFRLVFVPMPVDGVRLTARGPAPTRRIRGVFIERRPSL